MKSNELKNIIDRKIETLNDLFFKHQGLELRRYKENERNVLEVETKITGISINRIGTGTLNELYTMVDSLTKMHELFKNNALMDRIFNNLRCLNNCCDEALNDEWDKSNEGFEEMQRDIKDIALSLSQLTGIPLSNT
jgi:hypothetical protein